MNQNKSNQMKMYLSDGVYIDGCAIGIKGNPASFTGKNKMLCEMYGIHKYQSPHKTKLIEMILLCCFFDERVCQLAVQTLKESHFKNIENKYIFEGICATYTFGTLPTFKNVYHYCLSNGQNVSIKLVSLYNSNDYNGWDIMQDFIPISIETLKKLIRK